MIEYQHTVHQICSTTALNISVGNDREDHSYCPGCVTGIENWDREYILRCDNPEQPDLRSRKQLWYEQQEVRFVWKGRSILQL